MPKIIVFGKERPRSTRAPWPTEINFLLITAVNHYVSSGMRKINRSRDRLGVLSFYIAKFYRDAMIKVEPSTGEVSFRHILGIINVYI